MSYKYGPESQKDGCRVLILGVMEQGRLYSRDGSKSKRHERLSGGKCSGRTCWQQSLRSQSSGDFSGSTGSCAFTALFCKQRKHSGAAASGNTEPITTLCRGITGVIGNIGITSDRRRSRRGRHRQIARDFCLQSISNAAFFRFFPPYHQPGRFSGVRPYPRVDLLVLAQPFEPGWVSPINNGTFGNDISLQGQCRRRDRAG